MNVLDLFSGIGAFSLGLERVGMRTVAFCEIDEWCRGHLAHHWPGVPVFSDVRELKGSDVGPVDLICGGFPCQDISEAGKRVGIDGARSGLWVEMLRLVRELRPRWVIAENVAALRYRGYDRVHADLAEAGYACRPFVVAALHVGATQERKRAWIVANANDARLQGAERPRESHAPRQERPTACSEPLRSACGRWPPGSNQVVHIPRMADGPADRIHRLKALGNTIVPQIPEIIGRAIMNAALKQICCCTWSGEVRTRTDNQCAVHGTDELPARQRMRLQGELMALQEGMRDQRIEALRALHTYNRMKRKFFEKKKQLGGDI